MTTEDLNDNLPRFATKREAIDFAKSDSKAKKAVRYVIESRDREQPNKPFVVDSGSFVRSWERLVCCYENGKRDEDCG